VRDGGDEVTLVTSHRGRPTATTEALELAQDPATAGACRARAEFFSRDRCVGAYRALYREVTERHGA
jgi:hypothetical protein